MQVVPINYLGSAPPGSRTQNLSTETVADSEKDTGPPITYESSSSSSQTEAAPKVSDKRQANDKRGSSDDLSGEA
jgi:hypothetical protein